MKLSNYNTSKLTYKILYPNSFCLSFYKIVGKLVLPSFCVLSVTAHLPLERLHRLLCQSFRRNATRRYITTPHNSSLHFVAAPSLLLSSRHHVNRQEFSSAVIYTSTANVQMKSRIALRIRPGYYYCYYNCYYYSYYASYRTNRAQNQCKHQHTSWTASQ